MLITCIKTLFPKRSHSQAPELMTSYLFWGTQLSLREGIGMSSIYPSEEPGERAPLYIQVMPLFVLPLVQLGNSDRLSCDRQVIPAPSGGPNTHKEVSLSNPINLSGPGLEGLLRASFVPRPKPPEWVKNTWGGNHLTNSHLLSTTCVPGTGGWCNQGLGPLEFPGSCGREEKHFQGNG